MDKYFIYDPGGNGFETFATSKDQSQALKEMIDSYLDDEWAEEVENIVSGVITQKAKIHDIIKLEELNKTNKTWPINVKIFNNCKMVNI